MNPETVTTKHRRPFPFEDRVVLKELREEVSTGGILIPEHTEEEMKRTGKPTEHIDIGEVLAVGDGPYTDAGVQISMPFKPGVLT